MKKNSLHLLTFICSIYFLFAFLSCKKSHTNESANPITNSAIAKNAIQWVDNYSSSAATTEKKLAIDSNKNRIDWNSITEMKSSNEGSIILADYKVNQNKIQKSLFVKDKNNRILLGVIIKFSTKGTYSSQELNKLIINLSEGKSISYSGNIAFSKFNDRLIQENSYKNGSLYSISKLSVKEIRNNSSQRAKQCIDWYLQTYIDGTLESEVYLFTDCTSNVEEGGGGGGGTGETASLITKLSDDNHISCRSFNFKRGGSTNAQEAGLKGISFDVGSADGSTTIHRTLPNSFYITVPYIRLLTELVSPEEAAARTANALEIAGNQLIKKYKDLNYTLLEFQELSDGRLETELKNIWIAQLNLQFPGSPVSISVGRSNFSGTPTNSAIVNAPWDVFWNRLSGHGCW